jgi:hypothetical protein
MTETVFKEVRYDLSSLIKFIELGEIGLPDIQRPFVWKNIKVRDLFASMYRGFPIGYLLFWQNASTPDARRRPRSGVKFLICALDFHHRTIADAVNQRRHAGL